MRFGQHFVMPVHGHQIGGLGSQVVSDRNFTSAGFVQHGNLHAVAEGGGFRYGYGINVFDSGIIAYSVIRVPSRISAVSAKAVAWKWRCTRARRSSGLSSAYCCSTRRCFSDR